jgi:hypothetical protein
MFEFGLFYPTGGQGDVGEVREAAERVPVSQSERGVPVHEDGPKQCLGFPMSASSLSARAW